MSNTPIRLEQPGVAGAIHAILKHFDRVAAAQSRYGRLDSETIGEVTCLYQTHREEGRDFAGEIEVYEVDGKYLTAAEVEALGLIVPTQEDVQARLDSYSEDYDR